MYQPLLRMNIDSYLLIIIVYDFIVVPIIDHDTDQKLIENRLYLASRLFPAEDQATPKINIQRCCCLRSNAFTLDLGSIIQLVGDPCQNKDLSHDYPATIWLMMANHR